MQQTHTWRENRPLAAAVLAVVVLVSVLGIGGVKLKSVSAKASDYYTKNMAADMEKRIEAANTLVNQGESVLSVQDPALVSAQNALQQTRQATTPAQKLDANIGLTAAIGQLYETLRLSASAEKGTVLQTQWAEFLSRQNIMDNAYPGYYALEETAQKAQEGFPAALLARMMGLTQ